MSEPNPRDDQWKDMLRAVLGDQAADEVIASMEAQGFDPAALSRMNLSGPDFSALMGQLRSMLAGAPGGPVNWQIAEQVARQSLTRDGVATLTNSDVASAQSHLELANMWLNEVTAFDPTYGPAQAWTRLDWIAHAQSTFRRMTEPVAKNLTAAFTRAMPEQMPEEMKGMLGDQAGVFMEQMMATMTGMQFGAALAELARQSFGSTDTGLPFVEGHTTALVPANIAAFAEDLEAPLDEVVLYVAVREQAHARLFASSAWLRAYLLDTIEAWARDINIDMAAVEEQLRSVDMSNPQDMPEIDLTDVFNPAPTESQEATLTQLETILALIEGWVSEVTSLATVGHLPHAAALQEMFTRRRATGGPAEVTFGNLVGLEMRPKKVREAAEFWKMALEKGNQDSREYLWSHPDLLPDSDDLDKPERFLGDDTSDLGAEIDDLLADIFADDEAGEDPAGPEEPLPPTQ
ncbi:zinc-dependent metalloprotease [Flaviflexus huanghaiensis]|uniref:zinc-dependent metalloprotease n=1 Tax=Flaviflexus huanghaiensis TaxID=1111473 RepID=UPI0015FAF987